MDARVTPVPGSGHHKNAAPWMSPADGEVLLAAADGAHGLRLAGPTNPAPEGWPDLSSDGCGSGRRSAPRAPAAATRWPWLRIVTSWMRSHGVWAEWPEW